MTRLASFGPIFVVAAHPVVYFIIRNGIYNKTLVSIKKNKEKYIKILT